MPIYEYECNHCDEKWEAFHRVDARTSEKCAYCGKSATLLISLQQRPVIDEYYDEHLNAHVTGPAHKKRIMREKNLEEVG